MNKIIFVLLFLMSFSLAAQPEKLDIRWFSIENMNPSYGDDVKFAIAFMNDFPLPLNYRNKVFYTLTGRVFGELSSTLEGYTFVIYDDEMPKVIVTVYSVKITDKFAVMEYKAGKTP